MESVGFPADRQGHGSGEARNMVRLGSVDHTLKIRRIPQGQYQQCVNQDIVCYNSVLQKCLCEIEIPLEPVSASAHQWSTCRLLVATRGPVQSNS